MTLLIDNRAALAGMPGVHALVVGVSDLPHCVGGAGPPAEETFGMRGVAGAAISAQRFYDWLIERQQHFPLPLSTVRLLLSPLYDEDSPSFATTGAATLENLLDALYAWREDASANPANITFFYFSGWGFGIGTDIALVLNDFGRPGRPLMWATLSFDNIYTAMSPSFNRREVATTQFYFVDAGRGYFARALSYQASVTTAFALAPTQQRDLRTAPVFYSSVAGGMPFALVGGTTMFGEILIECLNGRAAEATDQYRAGQRVWRVSVNSLNAALEREFDKLETERHVPQTYALGGIVKDATICNLPEAPPMKALTYDRRKGRGDTPGLHVLIAGVSSYPHGKGGQAKPATIDLGIDQLSAAATSAYLMCQWFLTARDQLGIPLVTMRALLSPVAGEVERRPELAGFGDRCTLQNFLAAAADWRDDAARNPQNVALFYFAGHGAQRTKGDSVLLLEDFGDRVGGPLRNAVDTENIFFGMAPSRARKQIARMQVYCIDACRVRPAAFKNYQYMHATPVFEIDELEREDRFAPIYFAATSGSLAYAVPGKQTTFSHILLDYLDRATNSADAGAGNGTSIITVHSLDQALQEGIKESNRATGADQDYSLEGIAKDATILSLSNERSRL